MLNDPRLAEQFPVQGGGSWLPVLLIAVLLLGLIGMAVLRRPGHRAGRRSGRGTLANPQRQVEAVSAVRFEVTPILSEEEQRLFALIEAALAELAPGHRLMARVSLDEVLRPLVGRGRDWDRVIASIRSKRLDFAIFDSGGRIVAALSLEPRIRQIGAGRDLVRRTALEQANVPCLALGPAIGVDDLCLALDRLVGRRLRTVPAAA